jgi:adenine-specific DNA-methyltransferase
VRGPERAGKDILMGTVFPDYPRPDRPVDFAIYAGRELLALGLAHYDSDRGGSQEDRGPGDSRDFVREVLDYTRTKRLRTKVILLNDGPGLLLGSMWNDHAQDPRESGLSESELSRCAWSRNESRSNGCAHDRIEEVELATGIPRKRPAEAAGGTTSRTASLNGRVRLDYAGKRPELEILAAPAAEFETLWQPDPGGMSFNRLYYADNLGVLAALLRDRSVAGKVRLVYIDPPFATQSVFQSRQLNHAYADNLTGADFVEFLRARLVFLRELLAEDGSIYLHLDEKMVFEMKLVMDEVFGAKNYRNCITRKKCNPKNYTRRQYGNVADYILFYTKSDAYVWNRPVEPWTTERAAKEYQYAETETGRRFKKVPVHAPGTRRGETGKPWRGKLPPPGKHWQFRPATLDELDAKGEIYWSPTGNPRRIIYLDNSDGVGIQDIWLDLRDAHNQNIRITGYPTEKPPELLRRIIEASSNPGDIVLDCFSGSGTAPAEADNLGRKWIGVDNSSEAICTTLRRFAEGIQPMGDFVNSRPAPSLFDGIEIVRDAQRTAYIHRPIRDFVLFREVGIQPLPELWRRYVGARSGDTSLEQSVSVDSQSVGSGPLEDQGHWTID